MTENHPQRQVQERFREYIPGERRNLAKAPEHERILLDMRARLEYYEKKTADPIQDGPIPYP